MPEMTWHACYPEKWLNVLAELSPDVGLTYFIVCLRIYEKREPIPDTIEALARRVGYRPTHMKRIIEKLLSLDKLQRTEDGRLTNRFCEQEIADGNEIARATASKRSRAGKISAQKRQQIQRDDPTQLQLHIQEERKKESETVSRKRTKAQMREDWEPTDIGFQYARDLGFEQHKITTLVRACRDYHLKHGTLIAGDVGLAATWRTWCNNEIKFAKERANGQGRSRAFQNHSHSVTAAANRLQERIRDGGFVELPPRPSLDSTASENDPRLLSQRRSD